MSYIVDTTPVAPESSTVVGDRYRITLLTSRLLRLEWSPTGEFVDEASQVVWNRAFDPVPFDVARDGRALQIRTPYLHLEYDGGPFTTNGLKVQALGVTSYHSVWRYGEPTKPVHFGVTTNLGGTARTLDEADGAVPLEPGLVSTTGIAALDDSASLLMVGDTFQPRPEGHIDVYVFAHGHDFPGALADFYTLTGPQPLVPRFALGNWWSRYHPYTDAEYRALIERFEEAGIPFSVGVIDMDWHVTDVDPEIGSGWTGYTWNRDLFGDPAGFMAWLHERGLKIALNVHPADGIRRHEESYERVAQAMGIDPASGRPAVFDLTDPMFRDAYFDLVHHKLEDEGVDFWWLDWQQGPYSKIGGLDPLWLLNHLHFLDSARDGRRPLTFSRYAGPGSHRYPVGFSGDTVISWESLAFQPYFTATAANIGYGWWSHDIGGHMFGVKDDELATRWVQLGTFSPINRLHSTLNPFNSKEPWRFNPIAADVQTHFLQLRHRLLPYLYTMNERAHSQGRPIVEPLYWTDVSLRTLHAPTSFRFGSELLVAAITSPADRAVGVATVTTRLPAGVWVDLETGVSYDGDREVTLHRPLEQYPALGKPGAIVPMTGFGEYGVANPSSLSVLVVPGGDGSFELYEDDDAADPVAVRTRLTWSDTEGIFTIHPAEIGAPGIVPETRDWTITLCGVAETSADRQTTYDRDSARLRVHLGDVATGVGAAVRFDRPQLSDNDVVRRVLALVDRAEVPFAQKDEVSRAMSQWPDAASRARAILEVDLDSTLRSAVLELVLAKL